jgi:hypothetical protein
MEIEKQERMDRSPDPNVVSLHRSYLMKALDLLATFCRTTDCGEAGGLFLWKTSRDKVRDFGGFLSFRP